MLKPCEFTFGLLSNVNFITSIPAHGRQNWQITLCYNFKLNMAIVNYSDWLHETAWNLTNSMHLVTLQWPKGKEDLTVNAQIKVILHFSFFRTLTCLSTWMILAANIFEPEFEPELVWTSIPCFCISSRFSILAYDNQNHKLTLECDKYWEKWHVKSCVDCKTLKLQFVPSVFVSASAWHNIIRHKKIKPAIQIFLTHSSDFLRSTDTGNTNASLHRTYPIRLLLRYSSIRVSAVCPLFPDLKENNKIRIPRGNGGDTLGTHPIQCFKKIALNILGQPTK